MTIKLLLLLDTGNLLYSLFKDNLSFLRSLPLKNSPIFPSFQAGLLPLDRSYLANRGFRGRVRPGALSGTMGGTPLLWGNGRDWRTPAADEGDWGRIFPLGPMDVPKESLQAEGQVKDVVLQVTRFIRQAKQVSATTLDKFFIFNLC